MSDTNHPPSEQPADTTAPVTPDTSAQQVSNDLTATIDSLPADQLLKLLNGDDLDAPAPLKTPPAATPEEVIPEEPTETPPTGEQPNGDATTPGEGKTKSRLSTRFMAADEQLETAKAFELVRLKQAPDLLTALHQLRGTASPAAAPATEQPEAAATSTPATAQAPAEVSSIQSVIDDLSAQRDQAADDYDKPEVRRIEALIRQNERLLMRAELAAENAQVEGHSYDVAYDAAVEQLEQDFPEVLDESTTFFKLLDDRVTAAKVRNDPALSDPGYILKFAAELNKTLNPTQKPATPIPAKPANGSRMGMTVAPSSAATPRATRADNEALIKNASAEDLLAVLATH